MLSTAAGSERLAPTFMRAPRLGAAARRRRSAERGVPGGPSDLRRQPYHFPACVPTAQVRFALCAQRVFGHLALRDVGDCDTITCSGCCGPCAARHAPAVFPPTGTVPSFAGSDFLAERRDLVASHRVPMSKAPIPRRRDAEKLLECLLQSLGAYRPSLWQAARFALHPGRPSPPRAIPTPAFSKADSKRDSSTATARRWS